MNRMFLAHTHLLMNVTILFSNIATLYFYSGIILTLESGIKGVARNFLSSPKRLSFFKTVKNTKIRLKTLKALVKEHCCQGYEFTFFNCLEVTRWGIRNGDILNGYI